MEQQQPQLTGLLTVYEGPRLVDREIVAGCKDYRTAVRTCWELAKQMRPGLTQVQLAIDAQLYASHVSDYLSVKPKKRSLPAEAIDQFERACGNRLISQWLAWRARLPIIDQSFMEHIDRMRRVA